MTEPALTLYGFVPFDRSGRVRWLLHELELPHEFRALDIRKGENRAPEYMALNPTGKVPTLVDGDTVVFESGAVLEYLVQRHGARLAVPEDAEDRPTYLSWLLWLNATLDPVCFELVRPDLAEDEVEPRRARAKKELPRLLKALQGVIGDRETILSRGFTTLDILATSCLHYAASAGQLADFPALTTYLERMRTRPAAREAGCFRMPEAS